LSLINFLIIHTVPYLWEKTLFPPLLAKGVPEAALAFLAHPNPNCDLKFKVGRFLSKAFLGKNHCGMDIEDAIAQIHRQVEFSDLSIEEEDIDLDVVLKESIIKRQIFFSFYDTLVTIGNESSMYNNFVQNLDLE